MIKSIEENKDRIISDDRTIAYVYPKRVIWSENFNDTEKLLSSKVSQSSLDGHASIIFDRGTSVLIDFGFELQGGIQLITGIWDGGNHSAKIRVRFGESAMECMSEVGKSSATNDHSIRDSIYNIAWVGMTEIGNTGFRFVRVDSLEDYPFTVQAIRAKFQYRDLKHMGSFKCNDEKINDIFNTAVYTVQLNMQEYVWDGIKRDRLVWIGDMHPETSCIQYIFGKQECVEKSLDLAKSNAKLPNPMNGIPAYSLWWIMIHYDYYMHFGDIDYLSRQGEYLAQLIHVYANTILEDGSINEENCFLDWPSSVNKQGQKAGLHALYVMAYDRAAYLLECLGNMEESKFAAECLKKLKEYNYNPNGLKQALSLQVLAGTADASDAYDSMLKHNGAHGFSTFLGYYILQAIARSDNMQFALDCMKEYWGGMLEMGGTTFWEDFDLDWMENSSKLDELIDDGCGKKDIHGDFGGYCYIGYRHSLCHGWACGPAPFLMEYVLGVKPIKPGFKEFVIEPKLGGLEYAEGSVPTPYGTIYVRHKRVGKEIKSEYKIPEGIKLVKNAEHNN